MQPANTPFRLSRVNYPRSSYLSVLLLIIVFTCFGIWASAQQISAAPLEIQIQGSSSSATDLCLSSRPFNYSYFLRIFSNSKQATLV